MSASSKDKVFLAAGAVVFLGAAGWAFMNEGDIAAYGEAPQVPATGRSYEPTAVAVTTPEARRWAEAPSQSAGEKWRFEVFTPPQIFYNEETRAFTVIPPIIKDKTVGPVIETPKDIPPVTFGATLVKVEQPLFRLQLVGAVGEGPTARGTFQAKDSKDIILGTTGKKLPDLNLEIVEFKAERVRDTVAGATTVIRDVIYAVVRDTQTGQTYRLDPKNRLPDGPLVATLKLDSGEERPVSVGATFKVGDVDYTVGEIVLSPESVVVTKKPADGEAETKTLVIPPPPPPPAPVDPNAPLGEASVLGEPVMF